MNNYFNLESTRGADACAEQSGLRLGESADLCHGNAALSKDVARTLEGDSDLAPVLKTGVDAIAEDTRLLAYYKVQYDLLGEDVKSRCSWEEITSRLLAKDSHFLHLAEAMNEKGVLFGVDFEGNPLFADGGDGPIMTNMTYYDTRQAVYFKKEGDEEVKTGYEMFPVSSEIRMFEAYTGKPFVSGPSWQASYVENVSDPLSPNCALYNPRESRVHVVRINKDHRYPACGVRRLLRVKKS